MRDIVFKGKRLDNGEWVEGWIVPTMQNTYHYGYRIIETCGINYDELDFWEPSFISWEVDENTICQYTGLTDKNGNKIWENDIVGYYSEYSESWNYGTVSYGEFNCSCCNGVYGWTFECGDIRDYKSYEVKGNIFDNPELLKGGAE